MKYSEKQKKLLKELREATQTKEKLDEEMDDARHELRLAILIAHDSGMSLREIAKLAKISHTRVKQLIDSL